jgi:uncharacterized protein YecE (DUF72 family)
MARYDYDYSDNELREWVVRLKDAGPRVTDAHIIFNNCHEIQGIVNARRLGELLRAEAPAFKVIEPPAPPSPRQATLFGD